MDNNNSEKKNMRISKQQKVRLVEHMSHNLEFARGQFNGINSNCNAKEEWESLRKTLNALGGSAKSVEQWKKCWADLKAGVKKQINSRRAFMNRTGGGSWSDIPRDLSPLEEEILNIITIDAVDGDTHTPESGVENVIKESTISAAILEENYVPPAKKMKKSTAKVATNASKYSNSLQEARKMTQKILNKLD